MVGGAVVLQQTGGFGVFPRMDSRYMDTQAVRAVKALAAMPAADALELARRSSGGGAALNMTHMLFQSTLREEPPTVLALRIFSGFSGEPFVFVRRPAVSPSHEL